MPGLLAHVGGVVNCFHPPGTVIPILTAPPRVFVNGVQPVLNATNQLSVVGCLFTVPVPKPQPCVIVRLEPATRVFVNGAPALIVTPAALCYSVEQIPQGVPNSSPNQKRAIAI
jgi:hypothetical protein